MKGKRLGNGLWKNKYDDCELGSSWDAGSGMSRILLDWSETETDEVVHSR
jgi:hypothetical protein